MTDPDSAASPSDERGRTLAQFPLSRVTEVFHDEMLGVLPPAHTPSGMGGTFTVALLEDDPACPTVLARVCYGRLDEAGRYHPWREWDGYTFRVARTELAHPRRFADPTPRYRPPG
jgi:hypothetical protein